MSSCNSCNNGQSSASNPVSGFEGGPISLADYQASRVPAGSRSGRGTAWVPVCNDPAAQQGVPSAGATLPANLTTQQRAQAMTLLGRVGTTATKFFGTGYLFQNGEDTEIRDTLTLSVSQLWHNWYKPSPNALAIPGDPRDFPFFTIGDDNGTAMLLRGLKDEDSEVIWNAELEVWQVKAIASRPLCVKEKLDDRNGLEIVGFRPLTPGEPETSTRCLEKLCGAGIVIQKEVITTGTCGGDCGPSGPCGTYVATVIPFPEAGKIYGFYIDPANGAVSMREVSEAGGGSGNNGEDGADGQNATIAIGNVTMAPYGTSPQVINVGTPSAAILNFVLPAGAQGIQGLPGKDGTNGQPGLPGGRGADGPVGPEGPEGPEGPAGKNGKDGENGSFGTPSPGDLAKLHTLVQLQEYLALPIEISGTNRETLGSLHQYNANYLTTHTVGTPGTIPPPTGADLSTIDGVIIRVDYLSTDPQQEEADAATHSIQVTCNNKQVAFVESQDTVSLGTDVGNFYPRLDKITGTSGEQVVPYLSAIPMIVRVDSAKFPTTPAGAWAKYTTGANRVRVYVTGFLVTRKRNPIYTG